MPNAFNEDVIINGASYRLVSDYKDDDTLRRCFNKLAMKCFDFQLEEFYHNGYWDDTYIPYSLVFEDSIVANVSVCNFSFQSESNFLQSVQIATVMTDHQFRNKGLCKYLMEFVIKYWKSKCDMIYLFANDSAKGMYPKFGFKIDSEWQHYSNKVWSIRSANITKLDMSKLEDRSFLQKRIAVAHPASKFASHKTASLLIFQCTTLYKENVYYLNEIDSIVVFEIRDKTLFLFDVFCKRSFVLNEVIERISNNSVERVILGFTPTAENEFTPELLKIDNSTLFTLSKSENFFFDNGIRFPALTRT